MAELREVISDYLTSTAIDRSALLDKLSEFLAVEDGGIKLYERALEIVDDSEVRAKFREYLKQTHKHHQVLSRIIKELGGDPGHHSTGAKMAKAKGDALLKTMVSRGLDPRQAQLNAMENIVLAETKDHADWELLGKIARQSDDSAIRDVIKPAVSEIEQEEDEHLNWTRKKIAELQMPALTRPERPAEHKPLIAPAPEDTVDGTPPPAGLRGLNGAHRAKRAKLPAPAKKKAKRAR